MKLPRTAEEQERLGPKSIVESLETGDLVFFRTKGMGPLFKARHVGIYLGGGEFAAVVRAAWASTSHASTTATGTRSTRLPGGSPKGTLAAN